MKRLDASEITSWERYDQIRPEYRQAVIAYKRNRRLAVGSEVTLLFEDRETLRFQVQEMLWVERIREPEKIQYELDVYNELIPGDHELSATLMIEITDLEEIRPRLDRLIGIDEYVSLELGDGGGGAIRARFDPKQMEEERISAVQYIRFAFGKDQVERFCELSEPARIRIDHPHYRHVAPIPAGLRKSLITDLTGETDPLLAPSQKAAHAPRSRSVLFTTAVARAIQPERPLGPGHVVVEPLDPSAVVLTAEPALLLGVLEAVQRVAREVRSRHGRCRIHVDIGDEGQRMRWHVYALDP